MTFPVDPNAPEPRPADVIEWWDDPEVAENNCRYYIHPLCDEGNRRWVVPRDDAPPPSWKTDECARCAHILPLVARTVQVCA